MNDKEKKVLEFVRRKGPVLPVEVKKEIGGDTMLMGAILSGLIENKHLKYTIAKIGGSPLYYIEGQDAKLSRLRGHLSEKPGKAYDLVKENKVLRDRDCEPWQRVALREIKDFAKQLDANIGEKEEIFWKWHLVSDDEAGKLVFEMIKDELPEDTRKKLEEQYCPKEEKPSEEKQEPQAEKKPEQKEEAPKEENASEEKQEPQAEKKQEEEVPKEKKQDVQKEARPKKPKKKAEETYRADDNNEMAAELGTFHAKIAEYLRDKDIVVIEQKVLKKGKEFSFILKVPSTVGRLSYYAVAKDRKKASEKELSDAYGKGEELKMPVMFICTGELSKKARKFMEEKLPGMVFRNI
ncbi:MAG: hypothetical protein ABIB71_04530 [Candidatus Woesearchaeota archaeon]